METMMTGSIGRRVDIAETRTAARAMPGKDMTTSSTRMRVSAIHLRDVAATAPRTAATTRARPVAVSPTTSETLAP